MSIEELYAAVRSADLLRETHNSRHLDELARLEAAQAGARAQGSDRSRGALARLRRTAG